MFLVKVKIVLVMLWYECSEILNFTFFVGASIF